MAEPLTPLDPQELTTLRAEAEAERDRVGQTGDWARLILRLLATLDAARAAAPSPAAGLRERLAEVVDQWGVDDLVRDRIPDFIDELYVAALLDSGSPGLDVAWAGVEALTKGMTPDPAGLREARGDLRTRALKRIVMARDGRREALGTKRFSAAREAELLAYAASIPDEDILDWRDTGPAILRWIRAHQNVEGETPVRMIPAVVVGSTFAEVIKNTGWRVELFWNEGGGWFTARLISRTDRDGHGAYPGGYLVPFEDPIGASGDTPWEALANLSEAVLEWA